MELAHLPRIMGLSAAICFFSTASSPADEKPDRAVSPKLSFEVQRRQTIPLPGEGRNLILQRVKPPVLPPPATQKSPSPGDQALRAARLRGLAERRFLPLTVWCYQDGWNLLQWSAGSAEGPVGSFEAWSRTDFRSLWWMDDFVVDGVRYNVMPLVMGPSRAAQLRRSPSPLLPRPGGPDFQLVSGNPDHRAGLRPMEELHRYYQREAPLLEVHRQAVHSEFEAEQARSKANPPVPVDSVVSFWPIRSNRFPATPPAVLPGGIPLPSLRKP